MTSSVERTRGAGRAVARWQTNAPLVVLAWAVRISALVAVVDLNRPDLRAGSKSFDDTRQVITLTVAVISAAIALLLAGGLRRGRRRAWRVVTVVTAVGVLTHVHAGSRLGLAVNATLLIALVAFQDRFRARAERISRWRALRVLAVSLPISVAAGLALTADLAPRAGYGQWIGQTLIGLLGATPDLPFAHRSASFTSTVLSALGASTLLLTGLAFLAPPRGRAPMAPEDAARLRELLARHGAQDSLGYFALRADKLAVFSESGKAAVTYRVVGGASLASGDPLGDPEAWPGAIQAWLAEAREFAWTPGVLGASETGAAAYARAGLDALEVGDEAVLELGSWRLDGRAMRGVRQSVNRAKRAGHTVAIARLRELSGADTAELCAAADQFRDGEVERGFSMALGRLDADLDPELLVVRIRNGEQHLVAVLAFVPWGSDGVSLDLMRRARDSENGVVELAVASVAEQGPALGLKRISLNFAVFRSAFERGSRIGAGPVSRSWRRILVLASRWWQIESLYRANVKYNPVWLPRYVCFRSAAELPGVTLAALEAEAFVQRPRLLRLLGR